MPTKPSSASPVPPSGNTADQPKVKIQKREAAEPVLREKLCATCGRPFPVTAEQKFYDCPYCYKKSHPAPKPRRDGTQVLIQIRCMDCGTVEYLDFTPPDPKASLCRACYSKLKREPRPAGRH